MNLSTPIVIVDTCTLFREGLRRILTDAGFHAVWCSDLPPSSPISGLSDRTSPLLIVGSEIGEACLQVSSMKRIYPDTKAVILADSVTQHQFIAALRCGAETLVLKHSSCDALIATLRLVADGVALFPTAMIETLISETAPTPLLGSTAQEIDRAVLAVRSDLRAARANLSTRESDVLNQLLLGLSNKEIARGLAITEATVKVHVKAIFRKAGVRSRTQIVMWASQQYADRDVGVLARAESIHSGS